VLRAHAEFRASSTPEAVWGVYTDAAQWPRWSDDILWADIHGAFAAGTTGRMRFKGLPATAWEVLAAQEPRAFRSVVRLPLGIARLEFDHTLEPVPGGTRVRESVDFRGPLGLLVGLLQRRRWQRRWPAAMGQMCALAFEAQGRPRS